MAKWLINKGQTHIQNQYIFYLSLCRYCCCSLVHNVHYCFSTIIFICTILVFTVCEDTIFFFFRLPFKSIFPLLELCKHTKRKSGPKIKKKNLPIRPTIIHHLCTDLYTCKCELIQVRRTQLQ